jgi:hypothetical protein
MISNVKSSIYWKILLVEERCEAEKIWTCDTIGLGIEEKRMRTLYIVFQKGVKKFHFRFKCGKPICQTLENLPVKTTFSFNKVPPQRND